MSALLEDLPLPPPSQRRLLGAASTALDGPPGEALRLLSDHAAVLLRLSRRSKADFRPLPVLLHDRLAALCAAFTEQDPLPPSLLRDLAPLLRPRLLRLGERLRCRLGRTRCELPLSRLREMDPASLRRNLRRPGRDLIEKAGPRQRLCGVRRIEKYDTQENRVLVAACSRFERESGEVLSHLAKGRRKAHEHGRKLLALLRAASALGKREELAGVGRPRPGDRPSFALLKDPDYRAIYRGLQLLRQADDHFCDEWRARGQLYQELLLLAAWTWLDLRSGAEPVPNWVRIHPDRECAPGGSRIESLHDGRWLRFSDEAVEEWRVSRREGEIWLQHRLFMDGELIDAPEISLSRRLLGTPADRRVHDHLDAVLAPLLSPVVTSAPVAVLAAEISGPVALSALGPRLLLADQHGVCPLGVSAAAVLRVESGEGHREDDLPVFGRLAALLRQDLCGPLGLHRERADLCGRLLKAGLRKARCPEGDGAPAVVVPDRIDELALSRLREGLGQCWAVWHSVAVALCWAEEHPPDGALGAGGESRVLVLALSAAASDVALLSCQMEEGQRVFLRRAPPRQVVPPAELLLLDGAGDGADRLRAAWLRAPDAREVWIEGAAAAALGGYQRAPLPDVHDRLLAGLYPALEAYRAQPPDVIVLSGGDDRLRAALGELFSSVPVHVLGAVAAVRGAQIFLRRHALGLPTWKEELPPLSAQVRNEHHLREWIEIIPPGQWVRPGEPLEFLAKKDLILDPGRRQIDLPLYRGDAAPMPFCLHIAGRPLPLSRPVKVRIVLRFRYGQEGLSGELRPQGDAPFSHIPFSLGASSQSGGPAPIVVPEYRAPAPPTREKEEKIRERFAVLRDAWMQVPQRLRRGNKNDLAYWPPILQVQVTALAGAESAIQGSGPDSLGPSVRALLAEQVAPWLDWLLGLGKAPDREGEAPALGQRLREAVLRARGKCGVRTARASDAFPWHVQKILDSSQDRQLREESLKALGGIIDGQPDSAWDALVNAPATSFPDLRWQGWAMSRALYAHPALAPALSEDQAERALVVICEAVRKLPTEEKFRDHFAVFFLAIPHLCRARLSGRLPLNSSAVQHALETMEILRGQLPIAVRTYAPGQRDQDEPVSVAHDALLGRRIVLPRVEAVQ